jgi:hypothetical protein
VNVTRFTSPEKFTTFIGYNCSVCVSGVPRRVLTELAHAALGWALAAVLYRRFGRFAREPNPAAPRAQMHRAAQTAARSRNCHTS